MKKKRSITRIFITLFALSMTIVVAMFIIAVIRLLFSLFSSQPLPLPL